MSKMKIDEYIEKAFTSGDLETGGLLGEEQAGQLLQGAIDEAVVLPEVRKVPMAATKRAIDKITYTGAILQRAGAVGTAPGTTAKPTLTKVSLSCEEFIVPIDIGYDVIEDNIEKDKIWDTVMALTAKRLGFDMDQVLLNSVYDADGTSYLSLLSGVFEQATSHIYNASAAVCTKDIFSAMYKLLPGKYARAINDLRFYVSHLARHNYIDSLGAIGVTDAFTKYLIEANEPKYQGYPVRTVPAIDTESISYGTGTADGSKALLINPKNIVLGLHRDITYEMQRQPRKRVIEVTITMRMDVKLEEADAVVKATNIRHG